MDPDAGHGQTIIKIRHNKMCLGSLHMEFEFGEHDQPG